MKAFELINALQSVDPDTEVAIRGYEGGYNYVAGTRTVVLVKDYHKERWMGPHELEQFVDFVDQYGDAVDKKTDLSKFVAVIVY